MVQSDEFVKPLWINTVGIWFFPLGNVNIADLICCLREKAFDIKEMAFTTVLYFYFEISSNRNSKIHIFKIMGYIEMEMKYKIYRNIASIAFH